MSQASNIVSAQALSTVQGLPQTALAGWNLTGQSTGQAAVPLVRMFERQAAPPFIQASFVLSNTAPDLVMRPREKAATSSSSVYISLSVPSPSFQPSSAKKFTWRPHGGAPVTGPDCEQDCQGLRKYPIHLIRQMHVRLAAGDQRCSNHDCVVV